MRLWRVACSLGRAAAVRSMAQSINRAVAKSTLPLFMTRRTSARFKARSRLVMGTRSRGMQARRRARAMLWRRARASRLWRRQARPQTAGPWQWRPSVNVWPQIRMMRCEFNWASARSIVQDRLMCAENARGKMQGNVTKVTRFPESGKLRKEPPGCSEQPHTFQRGRLTSEGRAMTSAGW